MSVDGTVRSPLLIDYGRWRRVIFEFPDRTTFQRMNDSFVRFAGGFNAKRGALALTNDDDSKWKGQLTVHRRDANRMALDGQMGQHTVHMQLSLMDRNKFVLVSRGFHWIQDYPFNR